MSRVYDAALNEMWAMEEAALERLLTIAAREHSITDEALEAYRAKTLANADRALIRDGVAIINAEGALFPKANLFTAISGATSYDSMMRDLYAARDAGAKGIILNIDSPGGAVTGASELAGAIHSFRGSIPIVAYVGGMGASAAYWVASGADRIVVSDTAMLGSLGVQATMRMEDDPKGAKSFTFISSQSPMKNASPATDAGAKAIQARVDALAQVFVDTVARNRGVDTETALNNFGKGGIFVGKEAVQAGLADAVGNFETVFAELASGSKSNRGGPRNKGTNIAMSETTETTAVTTATAPAPAPAVDVAAEVAKAVAAAQTAERARIAGLNTVTSGHGVASTVLNAAIADGSTVEAFALKVATAASEANAARVAALGTDETTVAEVKPSTVSAADPTDTEAAAKLAAEIAACAPRASAEA